MAVTVDSWRTWAGGRRFQIVRGHANAQRELVLDEDEAREIHAELGKALAAATPPCIDCGSVLHSVDDPGCPSQHDCED